jgi:hypothetical protein
MAAPGININVFDLTLYAPRTTNAVMGCIGPATKGAVDQINDFTDEGNFVSFHGRPTVDRAYAQRAFNRYLKRGNQGKFVRIAGPDLAAATVTLYAADGLTPILRFTAATRGVDNPGSWANDLLRVGITHNGSESYNVLVYFDGEQVEPTYLSLDNGTVATVINNQSSRVRVEVLTGAGATFPAETLNSFTFALEPVAFSGGEDGSHAQSKSANSSTGGLAGKRIHGTFDATAGERVFENVLTIDAATAGKDKLYGTVGTPVIPGTFTIRVETAAAVYAELADDADESYGPGGAGLGLLAGAGGIQGFIDYRTGAWGVDLSPAASAAFLAGSIDAIWVEGEAESVGSTSAGQEDYSGNLSQFPLAPGFYPSNKATFFVSVDEQAGIATPAAAGAASSEAAIKSLAGWIMPGTVVLALDHDTDPVAPTIYDDGFGGFRTQPGGQGDAVVGTINYRTGVWSVTTWDPIGAVAMPAAGDTRILAQYDIMVVNMGGGAVPGQSASFKTERLQASHPGGVTAADTDVGAILISNRPVSPGEVKLLISDVGGSPFTAYDDGLGGWLDLPRGDPRAVAVTGAIDYVAGTWTITPGGAIAAAATVDIEHTFSPFEQGRRALRGTGPQYLADTTPNAAGLKDADPAAANSYNGSSWLDHTTGAFAFGLDLVPTGDQTFNLEEGAAITAVYAPADILGYGDGAETVFTGTMSNAPHRVEAGRLLAFQSGQASVAATGDPQVARSFVDPVDGPAWTENTALASDPDNFIVFATGATSIQWTGAPLRDEAVFIIREDVVAHLKARYPGDIGNERPVVTDGLYAEVSADPTLAGTLRLQVFFDSSLIEAFGQADDLEDLADKVNDPNTGSDYVTLEIQSNGLTFPVDTDATQRLAMSGAFTLADVIGTRTGNQATGMQLFRNYEVVPLDWLMVPGQWHRQVISALQELCELKGRRCIGIIPTPDSDTAYEVRNFINGEYNGSQAAPATTAQPNARVPFPPQVAVDSSHLAVFAPWLQYFDSYTNQDVLEPPDGDIATLVAITDSVARPWYPIAGNRRGRVLADRLKYSTPREDRNLLYGVVGTRTEVVNSIVARAGRAPTLQGQRTTQRSPTALDRLNVRWTVNVIQNQIDAGSQDFVFELNDSILWREIEAQLNDILEPIIELRGLQDAYVLVDQTTTTAADIDNLTVNAKLFIKPARAAEYLNFDLILTPTGTDFSEVAVAG